MIDTGILILFGVMALAVSGIIIIRELVSRRK